MDDDFNASIRDYESDTRGHYKDHDIAEEYLAQYDGPLRFRNISHRLIARGERRAIQKLLLPIAEGMTSVADIPCGTGKLHTVFDGLRAHIIAADVSREMLALATKCYQAAGRHVSVARLDATLLPFSPRSVDTIVSLRLLHRVPDAIKAAILREFTRVARKHVLVSIGVTGAWQRIRLRLRRRLTGLVTIPYPILPRNVSRFLSVPGWSITGRVTVLPVFSGEVVFRLSRRAD